MNRLQSIAERLAQARSMFKRRTIIRNELKTAKARLKKVQYSVKRIAKEFSDTLSDIRDIHSTSPVNRPRKLHITIVTGTGASYHFFPGTGNSGGRYMKRTGGVTQHVSIQCVPDDVVTAVSAVCAKLFS